MSQFHEVRFQVVDERPMVIWLNQHALTPRRCPLGDKRFNARVDEPDMPLELRAHLKEKLRLDSLGDRRGVPAR